MKFEDFDGFYDLHSRYNRAFKGRRRSFKRRKSDKLQESIDCFIEDIDKYYNHCGQEDPKEGLKEKVGLVLSLLAFFAGIKKVT